MTRHGLRTVSGVCRCAGGEDPGSLIADSGEGQACMCCNALVILTASKSNVPMLGHGRINEKVAHMYCSRSTPQLPTLFEGRHIEMTRGHNAPWSGRAPRADV